MILIEKELERVGMKFQEKIMFKNSVKICTRCTKIANLPHFNFGYPFVTAHYYFDEFMELKGAYTETLQNPREFQRGIIRVKYNLNTAGN
uniref:Uncharacterized protein n=1 Tax=Glossina palpalis gambiensis TaxID=67801 RepID=A0A1B0BY92_9MUSC